MAYPFALSLSKGLSPIVLSLSKGFVQPWHEGFDKLSPNGVL
ncbi:MAG: hypothetical protein QUV35_14415 [Hydrogenophaga sp.]|nr:hypothetical protein [Hydrogenophaga sp.]MDM7943816.1 hypothetical protein [Hydrogenophaga sp.]